MVEVWVRETAQINTGVAKITLIIKFLQCKGNSTTHAEKIQNLQVKPFFIRGLMPKNLTIYTKKETINN